MAEIKTQAARSSKKEHLINPFVERGKVDDEVTLKFDDGQEFYVSANFLKMASPVFTKILESDFKEKQTKVIELKDKNTADFLELLNYLHPAVLHRITENTVFKIVPLAEEYGIVTAVADCRSMLKTMVTELDGHTSISPYLGVSASDCYTLNKCFEILQISLTFSYTDIENIVVSVISSFPSKMYLVDSENDQQYVNKKCVNKYLELQENIQLNLLKKRLIKCDVNCTIEVIPKKRKTHAQIQEIH